MTIPTKPDFAKAYQSANEILVTSSVITKFPFSTKETVLSQLGCSKKKEDKYYLEAGLDAMLTELTPKVVIVYGSCNPHIFGKYAACAQFVSIPDWTTYKHSNSEVA